MASESASASGRLIDAGDWLTSSGRGPREFVAAERRLRAATTIPELLQRSCEAACEWCGFTQALILAVEDDVLTATGLGALSDPESDALRRRVLANPVALRPGTAEAELIRGSEGGRGGGGEAPSSLASLLGLEHFALGAVIPEKRVLALLLVARGDPPVDTADRDAVHLFAHLVGLAVERLFLRVRMREMALELRHLIASAQATMKETLESPVALPVDYGAGPVFPAAYPAAESSVALEELLTARERQIAGHMVAGLSNRQIAAEMHLSPETVKGYVGRVLRKLGASNRVDAVTRYLRLASPANDR
jgi:DNA-binding CsgD family transcriptional regulator